MFATVPATASASAAADADANANVHSLCTYDVALIATHNAPPPPSPTSTPSPPPTPTPTPPSTPMFVHYVMHEKVFSDDSAGIATMLFRNVLALHDTTSKAMASTVENTYA